ncbi:MAG TPA: hypothetical protein PK957_05235 [Candidatus Dojkabacteria bacterium]|nr:hypothetical protein [Candidatus Dojkabacteria bacterium]HQF36368.1 hypothetical protein [Candidatus Dojkabacteria bacterium]
MLLGLENLERLGSIMFALLSNATSITDFIATVQQKSFDILPLTFDDNSLRHGLYRRYRILYDHDKTIELIRQRIPLEQKRNPDNILYTWIQIISICENITDNRNKALMPALEIIVHLFPLVISNPKITKYTYQLCAFIQLIKGNLQLFVLIHSKL